MMAVLLQLWRVALALGKIPGALEALLAVANAARAGDGALVRAHAERLATITGALAANRL
jgi:hypothetical protein